MPLAGVGPLLRTVAATCLIGLCAAAPAAADQVTISDPDDIRTCYIAHNGVSDYGGACNGAFVGVVSGGTEYSALLWFDVDAYLPFGSTVSHAELRLPNASFDTACDLDLVVRKQQIDWWSTTPTWTSPDGGTTSWDGGSSWWSGWEYHEDSCDDDDAIFDVSVALGDWTTGNPMPNQGFQVTGPGPFYGFSEWDEEPELYIEYEPA